MQARGLGCADELTAAEGREIKVGAKYFDDTGLDPKRVRNAKKAWISLVTTYQDAALEIVQSVESPSVACWKLQQHYRAGGLL